MEVITVKCSKCDGKGFLTEYRHIAGGVCFACSGKKVFTYQLKQFEKREAKKKLEAEKKLEELEKRRKNYAETLYAFAITYQEHPEFIRCMRDCPSATFYEQHLANTMLFMKSKGLLA